MDKRNYIPPSIIDLIKNILNDEGYSAEQKAFYIDKVNVRLGVLMPLVDELASKGIKLKTLSNDLDQEYKALLGIINKKKQCKKLK